MHNNTFKQEKIESDMDPIILDILKTFVEKSLIDKNEGITPYKIMRKYNFYPSFAYKLIKKLEMNGLISCNKNKKKKQCKITLYGLLFLYKYDIQSRQNIISIFSKMLGITDKTMLNVVLDTISRSNILPRNLIELISFSIAHSHINEVKMFLSTLSKKLNFTLVLSPNIIYIRSGSQSFILCAKNCKNCSLDQCSSIQFIKDNIDNIPLQSVNSYEFKEKRSAMLSFFDIHHILEI